MSDAPATPTSSTQTTPAAEVAKPAKPPPGSPQLADFYANQAAKARLADIQSAQDGMEAARAGDDTKPVESTTVEPTGRERGKDGKFKPKAGAEAKPAEVPAEDPGEATEEPGELEQPEPIAASGGLGQARKLIRQGYIAKALELIGLHPEKLAGSQWGAFRQREAAAVERERAASAKEQELKNLARELHGRYSKYDQARAALESEDWDTAFKLAFDMDANDYQRKRVSAMTTKDPKVAQLEKRLREFEQKQADDQKQAETRRANEEREASKQNYKAGLSKDLADSGDPRFSRAANKRAFIDKIFDIQEKHYDGRNTLDLIEAAEQAWEELYEGVAGETSPSTAVPVSAPTGKVKPVPKVAHKAATTLNPHEAAEAAPRPKLIPGSKEMRDFYARQAELAQLNGEA